MTMAEESADAVEINAGFEQVRGEGVAIMPSSALSPLCRVPDYAEFGPPAYQGRSVGVG
jgi:hypothetical protein